MARYEVKVMVEGRNAVAVEKAAAKALAQFPGGVGVVHVHKLELNKSRSARLADAEALVQDALSQVQELRDEMQNWMDSIPENLQNGQKASEVQEAIDSLECVTDCLESCDFSSVNFPGMR